MTFRLDSGRLTFVLEVDAVCAGCEEDGRCARTEAGGRPVEIHSLAHDGAFRSLPRRFSESSKPFQSEVTQRLASCQLDQLVLSLRIAKQTFPALVNSLAAAGAPARTISLAASEIQSSD